MSEAKAKYFCGWKDAGGGPFLSTMLIGAVDGAPPLMSAERLTVKEPLTLVVAAKMNPDRSVAYQQEPLEDPCFPIRRGMEVTVNLGSFALTRWLDEENADDAKILEIYRGLYTKGSAKNAGLTLV